MSEPSQSVLSSERRVGTLLKGKWRIDAILGTGGMATVFAATHRNKKRVAIKMLHPEVSLSSDISSRFLREGYVANTVDHPGTVAVLDDDVTDDGAAFLVMELLEGETVEARQERKGGRLGTAEVLWVAERLLDVLVAAHAKGIIHRDIKPDNLFITADGRLKVLDFGIARMHEASTSAAATLGTKMGSLLGTPGFMPPEQARGRIELLDARTDLWSVGATLFTLLTDRPVHQAETLNEQLIYAATMHAPAIGGLVPELPASLAAIIDQSLAYEKEDRWPSAATMLEAIRSWIEQDGSTPMISASLPRAVYASGLTDPPPASRAGASSLPPASLSTSGAPRHGSPGGTLPLYSPTLSFDELAAASAVASASSTPPRLASSQPPAAGSIGALPPPVPDLPSSFGSLPPPVGALPPPVATIPPGSIVPVSAIAPNSEPAQPASVPAGSIPPVASLPPSSDPAPLGVTEVNTTAAGVPAGNRRGVFVLIAAIAAAATLGLVLLSRSPQATQPASAGMSSQPQPSATQVATSMPAVDPAPTADPASTVASSPTPTASVAPAASVAEPTTKTKDKGDKDKGDKTRPAATGAATAPATTAAKTAPPATTTAPPATTTAPPPATAPTAKPGVNPFDRRF